MICTELWNGQGAGNQLHSYIMARILAKDLGVDFGIQSTERFKCSSFMNLDFGVPVLNGATSAEGGIPEELPDGIDNYFSEKRVNHPDGSDIRDYDERVKEIKDNTKIEGIWQSEKYWKHKLDDVREWLKVEPLEMKDNLCIINFRGGEYTMFPELFLPKGYWTAGIAHMKRLNPEMEFEVHTDDPLTAREFFPGFRIIQDIGLNWRSIRYAKYLLLSNSSFAILPALINEDVKQVIAPWGWARRNKGYWATQQNEYSGWMYI